MNNDLISREALKKDFKIEELYWGKRIIDIIDNAPPIEITEEQAIDKLHETGWLIEHDKEMTERPHGKWILTYPYQDRHEIHRECSICGDARYIDDREYFVNDNFCPECGAKMDKKEADTEVEEK